MEILIIDNETMAISLIFDDIFTLIDIRIIEEVITNITAHWINTDCQYVKKSIFDSSVSKHDETIINAELYSCKPINYSMLLQLVNNSNLQNAIGYLIYHQTNLRIIVYDVIIEDEDPYYHSTNRSFSNSIANNSFVMLIIIKGSAISCCILMLVIMYRKIKVLKAKKKEMQTCRKLQTEAIGLETNTDQNANNMTTDDEFEIVNTYSDNNQM